MFKKITFSIFLFALFLIFPQKAYAFTFVAWGDNKTETDVLKALSVQVKSLNPNFTIFSGDLEENGFTQVGADAWKNAVDGGSDNGIFDITFPVRGNHDDNVWRSVSKWVEYHDISKIAETVGAYNYSELNNNLTYSFDYENSRFMGVDVVGDINILSNAQIAWIDRQLTDAESKGLTHAFIFYHATTFCVAGEHCSCSTTSGCVSTAATRLVEVINKHPIVTAIFQGHEHVLAHTHIDSSRIPNVTHPFEQIVSADAGSGPIGVNPNRTDYHLDLSDNKGGFVLVDVNDKTVEVNFYHGGIPIPQKTLTFSKEKSVPDPEIKGDVNSDGKLGFADIRTVLDNLGNHPLVNPKADVNTDQKINFMDIITLALAIITEKF